jgi:hypothetical protein
VGVGVGLSIDNRQSYRYSIEPNLQLNIDLLQISDRHLTGVRRSSRLQAYKPTSLQAYKPTSLQAYKPTSLQAYKPTNLQEIIMDNLNRVQQTHNLPDLKSGAENSQTIREKGVGIKNHSYKISVGTTENNIQVQRLHSFYRNAVPISINSPLNTHRTSNRILNSLLLDRNTNLNFVVGTLNSAEGIGIDRANVIFSALAQIHPDRAAQTLARMQPDRAAQTFSALAQSYPDRAAQTLARMESKECGFLGNVESGIVSNLSQFLKNKVKNPNSVLGILTMAHKQNEGLNAFFKLHQKVDEIKDLTKSLENKLYRQRVPVEGEEDTFIALIKPYRDGKLDFVSSNPVIQDAIKDSLAYKIWMDN